MDEVTAQGQLACVFLLRDQMGCSMRILPQLFSPISPSLGGFYLFICQSSAALSCGGSSAAEVDPPALCLLPSPSPCCRARPHLQQTGGGEVRGRDGVEERGSPDTSSSSHRFSLDSPVWVRINARETNRDRRLGHFKSWGLTWRRRKRRKRSRDRDRGARTGKRGFWQTAQTLGQLFIIGHLHFIWNLCLLSWIINDGLTLIPSFTHFIPRNY